MALLLLYTMHLLIILLSIYVITVFDNKIIRIAWTISVMINLISLIRLGGVITVALKLVTSFK